MRITHNILITNFLRNLNAIAQRLEKSQTQLATSTKYQSPGDGPVQVSQIIGFKSASAKIAQYTKNVDDGTSQVSYVDTILQSSISSLGRARDLVQDGANDNMNLDDRKAIAQELNLLLDGTLSDANSRFRDRYMFAGWRSRDLPFQAINNPRTGIIDDVLYTGNVGQINRLVGDSSQLGVSVSGKDLFLQTTYTRKGATLPPNQELGFEGTLTLNGIDFEITADDTLIDIRNKINGKSDIAHVFASIDNSALVLESAYAVKEFTISDDKNNVLLQDLGLYVSGAFNWAYRAPIFPIVDSTPAIFTGAGPVANLTYDNTNNTLNIFLGADANGGVSKAANIKITPGTYASVADLITELQTQIDTAFGTGKITVSDAGGGVLQLETVATGTTVDGGDLVIGGPFNGLDDTAADDADLNLVAFTGNSPATFAGTVGVNGNDKLIIDLGPTTSKTGLDIMPQTIDLRAGMITDINSLVDEINYQVFQNDSLRGTFEASVRDGRVYFETTEKGSHVLASDFQISDGATGTLVAFGLSQYQTPAIYNGFILGFPYAIIAGVNDSMTVDIGPSVSSDGTNPDPVTLTIPAGVYGNINALAAAIATQIQATPELNGVIDLTIQGPPGFQYMRISSVKTGPDVRGDDLIMAGNLATAMGWAATPEASGAGTADGQGIEIDPQNIFNSMITMRNDLNGQIGPDTKVLNALNQDQEQFGLIEGDIVTVDYDAGSFTFKLLATDTFQDFVNNIQSILGSRADVRVTTDGRIEIENTETSQILDLHISAASATGDPRTLFNEIFDALPDNIPGLTSITSKAMIDPQRYQRLGNEDLALADFDLENLLRYEAIVGARANRLSTILDQFSAEGLNIDGLRNSIEATNIAEVVTSISQQEAVMQAALTVGAKVLTPSLLDYLV
jgi:flagellar hook-associated protein 3